MPSTCTYIHIDLSNNHSFSRKEYANYSHISVYFDILQSNGQKVQVKETEVLYKGTLITIPVYSSGQKHSYGCADYQLAEMLYKEKMKNVR